jgi:hypothetical protein
MNETFNFANGELTLPPAINTRPTLDKIATSSLGFTTAKEFN